MARYVICFGAVFPRGVKGRGSLDEPSDRRGEVLDVGILGAKLSRLFLLITGGHDISNHSRSTAGNDCSPNSRYGTMLFCKLPRVVVGGRNLFIERDSQVAQRVIGGEKAS